MNNILDVYENLADSIEETEDFRIYDFIYYLGINSVDKNIPKEEITRLINICKECSDNYIDSFKLARALTSIVYKERCMSLDELERVPSESIKHFYSEEKMYEMRYYFETYDEIITSPKEIMAGVSYTIARVVHNGYCAELHYCSDTGATIEYGTKTSHDRWENEIEDANWFNINLSDDYILNRLNCLYDEEFSDNKLSNERAKELNLIDNILSKHKVDDIEYKLSSQIIKKVRDFIYVTPESKIKIYMKKHMINEECDYPENNSLYIMLLSGDLVTYGDEQRTKQRHVFTHQVYKGVLDNTKTDKEDYYEYDITSLINEYKHSLTFDMPNNIFFTTSSLRDYHYIKQKNNAYYHIQAINLPFQNIEFYYIDKEEIKK